MPYHGPAQSRHAGTRAATLASCSTSNSGIPRRDNRIGTRRSGRVAASSSSAEPGVGGGVALGIARGAARAGGEALVVAVRLVARSQTDCVELPVHHFQAREDRQAVRQDEVEGWKRCGELARCTLVGYACAGRFSGRIVQGESVARLVLGCSGLRWRIGVPPKKIAITARMTVTRARRHYHKWRTGTGKPGTNYEQSFNDDIRTFGQLATASAQPPDPDLDPLRRLCRHVYDEWVHRHRFDSPSCTEINRLASHYIRQHP